MTIKSREHFSQIVSFASMTHGKLAPTDFDAFIEFNDRLFIIIETKYLDAQMPTGQRLALERICDAIFESGRIATVLVTSHNTPKGEDIDLGNTILTKIRWEKKWVEINSGEKLNDVVNKLKDKYIK
jgi:hypothetical protein